MYIKNIKIRMKKRKIKIKINRLKFVYNILFFDVKYLEGNKILI